MTNIGMKETLQERNIACFQPEELLSPLYEQRNLSGIKIVETVKNKIAKDERHPLWQVQSSIVCK